MKKLFLILLALPLTALAQDKTEEPKLPSVNFSVDVEKEVTMDILQVGLFLQEENTDLKALHKNISEKLNQALAKIKAQSAVKIQQNNRHTSARYNEKGRKTGWIERADLVLESKDFFALSQVIDDISDLFSIDFVQAKLSKEVQHQLEDEMTKAVLEKFRQKAQLTTDTLQAKGYRIVTLNFPKMNEDVGFSRNYAMDSAPMVAVAKSAEPVQLESGTTHLKSTLHATIELEQ